MPSETITIEQTDSAESQQLESIAREAVETLGEAVGTVANLTQEVVGQVQEIAENSQEKEPEPEPEIIYAPIDHSHAEYEDRIQVLEEVVRRMTEKAEIPETIASETSEPVSEVSTETQSRTQSDIPVSEQEPSSTESIIQPPADRGKPEPSGIWSFFKRIGW